MPNDKRIEKKSNGFHIGKSEKLKKKDELKIKKNPTNSDVMEMLNLIYDKLEKE